MFGNAYHALVLIFFRDSWYHARDLALNLDGLCCK